MFRCFSLWMEISFIAPFVKEGLIDLSFSYVSHCGMSHGHYLHSLLSEGWWWWAGHVRVCHWHVLDISRVWSAFLGSRNGKYKFSITPKVKILLYSFTYPYCCSTSSADDFPQDWVSCCLLCIFFNRYISMFQLVISELAYC